MRLQRKYRLHWNTPCRFQEGKVLKGSRRPCLPQPSGNSDSYPRCREEEI